MTNNQPANSFVVVAIDGGAASGKSTTARKLAARLHLLHVDTGSHYRAIALAALRNGISPLESDELSSFLDGLNLDSSISHGQSHIVVDQTSFTAAELRAQEVNAVVSQFAALDSVRAAVKLYQRSQVDIARSLGFRGIVMEGRDIGTVILPDANVKVFLEADPDTRQQRRAKEGASESIAARDRIDSSRAVAPLVRDRDAILIDNSSMSIDDVVEKLILTINARRSE